MQQENQSPHYIFKMIGLHHVHVYDLLETNDIY